ncbi:MAG: sulfite exporter TauE/SafE family protein [Gammaproteobacteria bacterium]|nr:sulfite exporter TauE/SafE family protein [Gammaproteobacteria bacterium]
MTGLETLDQFGWASVWLLGLSVGFTTCTAVCLPFLGTWALGQGQGGSAAVWDTAAFAAGKIAAYAVLGGAAGMLGEALLYWLKGDVGHWLIASTAIFAGVWLVLPRNVHRRCGMSRNQRLSPFSMGFALSFTPCAPLAALLAASASTGDILMGAVYGTLFGLGAAITPLFIVIPLLGKLGLKLQQDKPWMGRWLLWLGGAVLILIGLRRLQLIF